MSLFHANGNSTFGRVLSAYTLDMWSRVYPQLRLDQVVTRFARPMVKRISTICLLLDNGPIAAGVVGQALRISYLRRQPWETEPWKGLLVRNSPGAAQIPAPVIITQGGADGIVHPPVTASFARRLCRRSAAVTYRGYPGVNHVEAGARTAPEVVRWIADPLRGQARADDLWRQGGGVASGLMDDTSVMNHIEQLVTEEHRLLEAHAEGDGLGPEEHQRLARIKVELDKYWDLLRQRRARERAGLDPDDASLRDASTVERYLQ